MAGSVPPLVMSNTKDDLLKALNMNAEIYTAMAKEADQVYRWLTQERYHLKDNCSRKPPYDWSDIRDKSKDEAYIRIAQSGDATTSHYWALAQPTAECPNWIARWFLYHKFRYRDGRNRNPTKADDSRQSSSKSKSSRQRSSKHSSSHGSQHSQSEYYDYSPSQQQSTSYQQPTSHYSTESSSSSQYQSQYYSSTGYSSQPYTPPYYEYSTHNNYPAGYDRQPTPPKPYYDPVRDSSR